MFDWLDDALQNSSEVITASRRLARVLQKEHAEYMATSGATVWRSPTVLSLQDWLSRLLADSSDPESLPVQITQQQSRVLWERCLRREISDPLLNIGMLARQSRDSWNRLREWQVSALDCQRQARNKDQALFAKAAINYASILERENWIDQAALADLALREVLAGHCRIPSQLTLAGFDRVTPQLQTLIDAISASGGSIQMVSGAKQGTELSLCNAENSDIELRAAGAWAREQLAIDAKAQLGIVVTHLEQDAQRSLRLIKEGLIPGWQNATALQNAVVNVSYGKKLTEFPAVAIALLMIRWLFDDLSTIDVSRLLQTSLLGSSSNDDRVRIELRLRQQPDQLWSPKRLLAEIAAWKGESTNSDELKRLSCIADRRDQIAKRASPAAWVSLFDDVLQELNWPGTGSLQSAEFQLINRWRELLNDVARLDLVSSSMTASEALGRISSIANEIIFQPEATAAVVQVIGPLEAAGLRFDKLWVTGVSAENWPPAGRSLSLVSRDLQRERNMPDATPGDTLAYAQRVIGRLLSTADEVIVSYAIAKNDAQQSPSELLQSYNLRDAGNVVDPGWNARRLCATNSRDALSNDPVPGVRPGETISGGAATLQRQFVEPFAAFVMGRLGVRPLWPIVSGLPASIRGSLVHAALHRLYEECPSSDQINAWDDVEIESRTKQAVQAAFWRQERNADSVLQRLLALERERVQRLLGDVIAVDSARESFQIESVEQSLTVEIEELTFSVRIDRVDLAGADVRELLILDYKTGMPKRLLDRDNNPNDMQLVVYAYALDQAVGGIALLNVDSRAVALDGAGRQLTPKLDWDEVLGAWKQEIETAAQRIVAGDIRLNALQTVQAARPLGLLSRYRELVHE